MREFEKLKRFSE